MPPMTRSQTFGVISVDGCGIQRWANFPERTEEHLSYAAADQSPEASVNRL